MAKMLSLKKFILKYGGPFRPVHMGTWIRELYFKHYLPKYINFDTIKNVLDAGCGTGKYSVLIAREFPNVNVCGVDINKNKLWENINLPNLKFEVLDLLSLSEVSREDLIISIDNLEHIKNNRKVLEHFFSALRSGGYLYIAMPCEANEYHIFPRSWFKNFYEWEEHEHVGEQYGLDELANLLKSLGFKIKFSRHTFTLWGALAWELETLTSGSRKGLLKVFNVVLMPFYKMLGIFDLYLPFGRGHNLIIAQKI